MEVWMRRCLILLAAGILILAACSGRATPTSNVPTVAPSPTPVPTAAPVATCQAVPPFFDSLHPVNVPPITGADWARGPADAPITLVEYSDFQCPACAGTEPLVQLLLEAYGDRIRLIYRHFPLTSIHDKAQIAAEAAEAAGAQGKFWEMHTLLFERQQEWAYLPADQAPQALANFARELGLDVDRFTRDLEEHTFQPKVMKQYQDAVAMGLTGTPSFILNGRLVSNQGFLPTLIDEILARSTRYDPPTMQVDPARRYTATVRTPGGDIGIDLYPDRAPVAVNTFVFLARQGWYDHNSIFRLDASLVLQSGDPTGFAFRNPGFQCSAEVGGLSFEEPGVVGLFGPSPNSSNGKFFITLAPLPDLNGRYTAVGKVVRGLDILQRIPEQASGEILLPSLEIEHIRIEEQ